MRTFIAIVLGFMILVRLILKAGSERTIELINDYQSAVRREEKLTNDFIEERQARHAAEARGERILAAAYHWEGKALGRRRENDGEIGVSLLWLIATGQVRWSADTGDAQA